MWGKFAEGDGRLVKINLLTRGPYIALETDLDGVAISPISLKKDKAIIRKKQVSDGRRASSNFDTLNLITGSMVINDSRAQNEKIRGKWIPLSETPRGDYLDSEMAIKLERVGD